MHATDYVLQNRQHINTCAAFSATVTDSYVDPENVINEVEDLVASYPHHNSFRRTQRHFALIHRTINNFMAKSASIKGRGIAKEQHFGPLTVNELEAGEQLIIKHLQRISYHKEFAHLEGKGVPTSKAKDLPKIIDIIEDGLIRIVGRLSLADLPKHQ